MMTTARLSALAVALAVALPSSQAGAGERKPGGPSAAAPALPDALSAQRRLPPRTRILVTPARPLYRECKARLVPEWRPSGTVIVPVMRCWWVRG